MIYTLKEPGKDIFAKIEEITSFKPRTHNYVITLENEKTGWSKQLGKADTFDAAYKFAIKSLKKEFRKCKTL